MSNESKPRAKFGPTKEETIEQLARISCSLHGINANGRSRHSLGDLVFYEGVAWQNPLYLEKARGAFEILLPDVLAKYHDPPSPRDIANVPPPPAPPVTPYQNVYREGWLAGMAGKPCTPNPYEADGDRGPAWFRGWDRGSSGQDYDAQS